MESSLKLSGNLKFSLGWPKKNPETSGREKLLSKSAQCHAGALIVNMFSRYFTLEKSKNWNPSPPIMSKSPLTATEKSHSKTPGSELPWCVRCERCEREHWVDEAALKSSAGWKGEPREEMPFDSWKVRAGYCVSCALAIRVEFLAFCRSEIERLDLKLTLIKK